MPQLKDILQNSKREARSPKLGTQQPGGETPPSTADKDTCTECGGGGFVRREVPLEHPEFGRALPCRCVNEENREARVARLQRYSNLGPLTRLTFDNLIRSGRNTSQRAQQRFAACVESAETFAQEPRGWLVLIGPSGCGKTHIAAAVANRCLERGIPALFVVVPDLLDHLRAAYKPDADVSYDQLFEQVRNAPVLILDDLGTQSATPWAQEKLFQIINHRFNACLPTIVTTNVQLAKFDDRLQTRLNDSSLSTVYVLQERRPASYDRLSRLKLPTIAGMTFETFNLDDVLSPRDRELRENAFRHALDFAAEPAGWMVLLGGRSRDRTHLISAIANSRLAQGEEPLVARVLDLLSELRRAMPEGEEYYEIKQAVRDCPLLLLDDLEIGVRSDWVREELSQLLDHRSLARLPTVITTPNSMNRLLTDPGWERLARLLSDPSFCSEVPVGESRSEESAGHDEQPPVPRRKQTKARKQSG